MPNTILYSDMFWFVIVLGDDVKEAGLSTESIMSKASRLSTMMFLGTGTHYPNGPLPLNNRRFEAKFADLPREDIEIYLTN